jgi:hypothetical protein
MSKSVVSTAEAPQAIGAYSQAIRAGDTVLQSRFSPGLNHVGVILPDGRGEIEYSYALGEAEVPLLNAGQQVLQRWHGAESVAGGIDKLESERAQTLRQGRGDVVRHQQGIGTPAADLVCNHPERRRPQTAFGLHAVAHLAPLPA